MQTPPRHIYLMLCLKFGGFRCGGAIIGSNMFFPRTIFCSGNRKVSRRFYIGPSPGVLDVFFWGHTHLMLR